MSDVVVSKRYAEALFQLGQEKGTLDQLKAGFLAAGEAYEQNKELESFLTHPKVDKSAKKSLIENVFKSVHADVVNTLKLLVERNRTNIIPFVARELVLLINEASGIAEATVYSVRPLNEAEQKQLQQSFAKRVGKKSIHIDNVIDPSMIGGVKIRIGNTIYDGSISGQLHRIEQRITANK